MLKDTVLIDQNSKVKLYVQLFQQIKNAIETGKIKEGSKLPSVRNCAEELNLSRNTVTAAYKMLEEESYAFTKLKSGFIATTPAHFLSVKQKDFEASLEDNSVPTVDEILNSSKNTFTISNENVLLKKTDESKEDKAQTSVLSVSKTVPVYDCNFPVNDWKTAENNVFNNQSSLLDSPSDIFGEKSLRRAISLFILQFRKVSSTANQIVIFSGLDISLVNTIKFIISLSTAPKTEPTGKGLLAKLLELENNGRIPKIDLIFANSNTDLSSKIFNIISSSNFKCAQIKTDYAHLNAEKLKSNNTKILIIETNTGFEENKNITSWLESDPMHYIIEVNTNKKPIIENAIKAYDKINRIFYISTLSKIISPSINTSFTVIPPNLIESYKNTFEFFTACPSKLEQLIEAEFISTGLLEKNLTGKLY